MKKIENKYIRILLIAITIILIIILVYIICINNKKENSGYKSSVLDIDYDNSFHIDGDRTTFEIDNNIIYEEESDNSETEKSDIIKKNSNIDKDYFINDDVISLRTNNSKITNMYYDEKEIFSFDQNHMIGNKINTFDDTIVFTVNDTASGDITLLVYYKGLEYPLVLFDQNIDVPSINIPLFIKKVESTEDSLRVTTDCIFPGSDLLLYAKSAGSQINIDSCKIYNEYKDFEIGKVFEIKYSPNEEKKFTKFSDGIVKSIKLSDVEKYSSLCSK